MKMEQDRRELTVEMTRSFMALVANTNRDRNQPAFRPQDFWKLSYDNKDKIETEGKPKSLQEVKAMLGSKFKRDGE